MELKHIHLFWFLIFCSNLLIEPYGIETHLALEELPDGNLLLIEPYGIETTAAIQDRGTRGEAFNRTLWN